MRGSTNGPRQIEHSSSSSPTLLAAAAAAARARLPGFRGASSRARSASSAFLRRALHCGMCLDFQCASWHGSRQQYHAALHRMQRSRVASVSFAAHLGLAHASGL